MTIGDYHKLHLTIFVTTTKIIKGGSTRTNPHVS